MYEFKAILKKVVVMALTWEAKLVLRRYRPKIVAITGSIGKTSTKDAIYTALSSSFFVRKSEKSFNSEVGIPLTILGLKNAWSSPAGWAKNLFEGLSLGLLLGRYPEWLVLEVGADRPGDIKSVSKWLHPDVVIMTCIPSIPVHVEYFPTPAALAREKRYLVDALKSSGTLVLNSDDEYVTAIEHPHKGTVLRYGLRKEADIRAVSYKTLYRKEKPVGTSIKVKIKDHEATVHVDGALGIQHVYPTLVAIATSMVLEVLFDTATEALKKHETPPGRMRLLPGLKGTTIIDDTYNSSPAALKSALEMLGSLEVKGRKIAVLGDMMELGRYSAHAHEEVGGLVKGNADILFAIGIRAQAIAENAKKSGMKDENVHWFPDAHGAGKPLELLIEEGDTVLIKGSQSMRMERLVEEIMAEPQKSGELLVRQDDFWVAKS